MYKAVYNNEPKTLEELQKAAKENPQSRTARVLKALKF